MTALSSLLQKSFNVLDLAHFISFFSAHHILFAMLRLLNRRCWIVSNCLDSDVHIPSHILGLPKYSQIKYINFFRLFPCLVLFRLYPRHLPSEDQSFKSSRGSVEIQIKCFDLPPSSVLNKNKLCNLHLQCVHLYIFAFKRDGKQSWTIKIFESVFCDL